MTTSKIQRLAPLVRHLGRPHTWFPLTVAAMFTLEHATRPRAGWTGGLVWLYGALLVLLLWYLVRDLRALWRTPSSLDESS